MAKALATGTEARNRPASESAGAGLPVAARSALSAGVKLTSGANNASMIRPSRTLAKFHHQFTMERLLTTLGVVGT